MEHDYLNSRVLKIVHYLYDKEYVSEEAILNWYSSMEKDSEIRKSLKQLVDWLNQSSEEESDSDE